jgi:two-component system, chemotaxis family, chemotaxis protein CheY
LEYAGDERHRIPAPPAARDKPSVIFCTVETEVEKIQEALDAGAREYIMKPFDSDIIAMKFIEAGLA